MPIIPILTNVGISLAANLVIKGLRYLAGKSETEIDDVLVNSFAECANEAIENQSQIIDTISRNSKASY